MQMDEIRANHGAMTIQQLEGEVIDRDTAVIKLRAEMREIQGFLAPKRSAEAAANAGPAHLAQGIKG